MNKNLDELLNDLHIAEEAVKQKVMSEAVRLNVPCTGFYLFPSNNYLVNTVNDIKNRQELDEERIEREEQLKRDLQRNDAIFHESKE